MSAEQGGIPPGAEHGGRRIQVLLDCRWLGLGGAGRVTELLLAELRETNVDWTWNLWGDPQRIAPFVAPGTSIIPWKGDPTRWFGQADLLQVPSNDLVVYMHQIRPLRLGRSIAFVHDTIPIRRERRPMVRMAKRLFFRLASRMSDRIITVSASSRDSIVRDLGVPPSKIAVANLTVDAARVDRIRALRASAMRKDEIAYVGRFGEHKNLHRLCHAFQSTAMHQRGGGLILVGGSKDEVSAMLRWLDQNGLTGVDVRGQCSEAELDDVFSTCRAIVQPSLEEGYGLPAVEAAAVGVPVAASRAGYAAQIPVGLITYMDPLDEASITTAIDTAVARPDSDGAWLPQSTLREAIIDAIEVVRAAGPSSR